jgi:hypothetical protein
MGATLASAAPRAVEGSSLPAAGGAYGETSVVDGIRLTTVLPGRVFPRNSLVRVHVAVTNDSGKPVPLSAGCRNGRFPLIFAAVLNRKGRIVYFPPPLQPIPQAPCLGGLGTTDSGRELGPGKTLHRDEYVVLRGTRVAAVLSGAQGQIESRPILARLTHGTAARLAISSDGSRVTVSPGRPTRGPPLIAMDIECGPATPGGSPQFVDANTWHRAGNRTIHAPCALLGGRPVVVWHIIAGWPGQPVGRAFIDRQVAHTG